MWCIVLGNSFLGRRFSEGVIIIINMMKRTPKHNSPKHNFSSWGALGMRYCMLRIQAWPDECNYSIKQAASKTPAKRTESNQKRWNYKNLWENGYFSSNLSTLFHRDFHSKRLIPPKVLYLTCVRDKSENLKQQNPNGEFSKWWRCQERFQGHPLSDGPSPVRHAIAHLFCRLPALATCGEPASSHFNLCHPHLHHRACM